MQIEIEKEIKIEKIKSDPGTLKKQAPRIAFHGGPAARRKGYRMILWSFLATVIDGFILTSASCFFILAFSWIVQTSADSVLAEAIKNQHRALIFIEVFVLVGWAYMISVRGLLGASIGEWACDIRLGQPHERLHSGYVLRVALRSTIILLTGVITLPILSLLLGRDVAGVFSGLKLFSLQ